MGHQRLGILPRTRSWTAVINLITSGADAPEVARATARAAEHELHEAGKDPTLRYAFWLLTQVPLAAGQGDFAAALRNLGLEVGGEPKLVEICSAMIQAIDRKAIKASSRNDLSEMATVAAIESLHAVASREGHSLFGDTYLVDETRAALHRLARSGQFGVLVRDFFSRLIRRCLDYFLSRELPNHVGRGQRFPSLKDHDAFDQGIGAHCRETALIVEEFASGWFSKTIHEGGITPAKAGGFVHVAFDKIIKELKIRQPVDA